MDFRRRFPYAEKERQRYRTFLEAKWTAMIQHVKELRAVADEVDTVHKRAAFANITGATAGAAGGIMAIAGLVLIPATLGASAGLSLLGTVISVGGGVTKAVSETSEVVSNRTDQKSVENILQSCRQDMEEVCARQGECETFIQPVVDEDDRARVRAAFDDTLKEFFNVGAIGSGTGIVLEASPLVLLEGVIKSMIGLITGLLDEMIGATATFAARTGAIAAAGATVKVTGLLAAVLLPLDAYDIYKNGKDLSEGAYTVLAAKIREIADTIESIIKK